MPIKLHFTNTRPQTLSVPLDLAEVTLLDATLDDQGAYHIMVESAVGQATCHRCRQVITTSHGYGEPVTVRHLAVWGGPPTSRSIPDALCAPIAPCPGTS